MATNNELKVSLDEKIKVEEIKIQDKNPESIQDIFMAKAPEFCLKEYELVMNSLSESVKELRNLEIYCLVGIGAVWTWAASSYDSFSTTLIWWIPLPLIFFGWICTMATKRAIELRGGYLKEIEDKLPKMALNTEQKNLLRWENFFKKNECK